MELSLRIEEIIKRFDSLKADPKDLLGMQRFGINIDKAFGITIPNLRKIAKDIGKDHDLALSLWNTDYRESKILASMIDIPDLVTEEQMENWVNGFSSWETCDQCCNNLFVYTKFKYVMIDRWSHRDEEFVKRAGFVLIAVSAVHDKAGSDNLFCELLKLIIEGANDDRNFVKKAVNWALRQIGKRNLFLNQKAINICNELLDLKSKSAIWIAKNALRELKDEKILNKIKN